MQISQKRYLLHVTTPKPIHTQVIPLNTQTNKNQYYYFVSIMI